MPTLPGEINLTSYWLFLRLGSVTIYEWPANLIGVADGPMYLTLDQVEVLGGHSGQSLVCM